MPQIHPRLTGILKGTLPLVLCTSLALLFRLHNFGYITESLWHEDGTNFINDSYALGMKSIWQPIAGELFVYNRLVALIAKLLPLELSPYVFFSAWCLSYAAILWVLVKCARVLDIDRVSVLLVALAIAFQPSQGEAWFNLIHAHFFLGIALSLYVCVPTVTTSPLVEGIFLLIASLSGAFSIVITPVIGAQLLLLRNFAKRRLIYLIVPTCGIIQFIMVFWANNIGEVDTKLSEWMNAFVVFLSFGAKSPIVFVASAVFWIVAAISVSVWVAKHASHAKRGAWMYPIFACFGAACVFLSAAVHSRLELNPLDMESRYFLIPYSLLFFVGFVCSKNKRATQAILASALVVIFAAEFRTVDRPDRESTTGLLAHENMQWRAFTKWQNVRPNLMIPINSPLPMYPPSDYVQISQREISRSLDESVRLLPAESYSKISEVEVDGSKLNGDGFSFRATDERSAIYFDISQLCIGREYLAVEIDIWRDKMGEAMISWGQGSVKPGTENSLKRFYPQGSVTMQFAFRRGEADSVIAFHPAMGVKDSAFVRLARQFPADPSHVVGVPTASGGENVIRSARLLCLQ